MTKLIHTSLQTPKSSNPAMTVQKPNAFNLGRSIRAFKDDLRGTAAIEFAFIAPIMIITYFGLASISLLVAADRSVSHTASVTADLVTQIETADSSSIEGIFDASLLVMGKTYNNATDFSIDITSFGMDGNGTISSVGYAKLGNGFSAPYSLPAGISLNLINATSGLVVTRVKYNHQMLEQFSVKNQSVDLNNIDPYSVALNEVFMLKPRKSATIPFTGTISCSISSMGTKPVASC